MFRYSVRGGFSKKSSMASSRVSPRGFDDAETGKLCVLNKVDGTSDGEYKNYGEEKTNMDLEYREGLQF